MSKKIIRLTESDIRRIVKETVKKTIEEGGMDCEFLSPWGEEFLPVDRFEDEDETDDQEMHESESLSEIVRECVKRTVNEWADGTDTIMAYHVATVGADGSDQDEADFAYEIYDMLTHNQMTADEAIREITGGVMTADTEAEAVPRSAHNFGFSRDGRYFLTYDQYTGAFDVWEKE